MVVIPMKNQSFHDACEFPNENIRFYTQETSNDFDFSKNLAEYGDIYVNDAFGVSHRKHASVYGIRQFFKSKYMGKLVDKELKELNKIKKNPQHPLTLVIGGSKVSSKIKLLDFFLDLADNIIVGGGMAFPFIKLSNGQIGKLAKEQNAGEQRETWRYAQPRRASISFHTTKYEFT